MSYRIRVDECGKLVLQVMEPAEHDSYYRMETKAPTWRDATVEDIPVSDPFRAPMPEPSVVYRGSIMGEPLQSIG